MWRAERKKQLSRGAQESEVFLFSYETKTRCCREKKKKSGQKEGINPLLHTPAAALDPVITRFFVMYP